MTDDRDKTEAMLGLLSSKELRVRVRELNAEVAKLRAQWASVPWPYIYLLIEEADPGIWQEKNVVFEWWLAHRPEGADE